MASSIYRCKQQECCDNRVFDEGMFVGCYLSNSSKWSETGRLSLKRLLSESLLIAVSSIELAKLVLSEVHPQKSLIGVCSVR